jgi:hypothetical protein
MEEALVIVSDNERAVAVVTHIELLKSGYPRTPTEILSITCKNTFDTLDAAIADMPTDLLVVSHGSTRDYDLTDIDKALSHAADVEADGSLHSLVRYHARLLREHLSEGGRTRIVALQQAMVALDAIILFEKEKVSEVALDVFPSLTTRQKELEARRVALAWRPESEDDVVVKLDA